MQIAKIKEIRMKEVITSILEAESKAEEIVKTAQDKSKELLLKGETEADELKEKTIAFVKAKRKDVLKGAEVEANKNYNARISQGEKKAEELINTAQDKIDAVAENIVKEIIG